MGLASGGPWLALDDSAPDCRNAVGRVMEAETGEDADTTRSQSGAVLFYHLARFVVWGQEHRNLAASDQQLEGLLRDAAAALANTGVMVKPRDSGEVQTY